jgi:hypothetical protein
MKITNNQNMKQIKSLSLLFNSRSLTYGYRNFDKPENKSKITNNKHKKINPIKLELIQFTQRQGWDTVKKFKNLFKFKRNLKEFK